MKNFSIDAAMYFVVLILAFVIPISTAAASILVGLGVIFVIFHRLRTKNFPQFDSNVLEVLAVFIVCEIFVATMSWEPKISFREVFGEIHRFFPLIFALTFVKTRKQLCGVLIATILAFLLNDLAGIVQYFALKEPRAFGFSHTPTFYGSFMLMQLPFLIFASQIKILPQIWRKIALATVVLSLICLVLSMTRGAWLAFVCVAVIFFILEPKYRLLTAKIFAGLAILFVIVAICSPTIHNRLETMVSTKFQSNTERILMWKSAFEIFKDYPLSGIGQKMFVKAYNEQYISPEAVERPEVTDGGHTQPHNNLLNAASEGGIVGLSAFIGLYAYFFWRFWHQKRREERNFTFSAGLTAILILAGLQFEGLTDTNMTQVPIMREFWLLTGVLMASEHILNQKSIKE